LMILVSVERTIAACSDMKVTSEYVAWVHFLQACDSVPFWYYQQFYSCQGFHVWMVLYSTASSCISKEKSYCHSWNVSCFQFAFVDALCLAHSACSLCSPHCRRRHLKWETVS
jgi:hypothetical protein